MNKRFILAAMSLLIALAMGILPADETYAQGPFLGDVNKSNTVTTLDNIRIHKHLLGSTPFEQQPEEHACMQRLRADVNADRRVSSLDRLEIDQHILLGTSFSGDGLGLGDVNEDGDVDMGDVGHLTRYFQGLESLTPQGKQNADVDGSGGNPTFADANQLWRCINGSIPKLPAFMN